MRFQSALARVAARSAPDGPEGQALRALRSWADLALAAGYSDQSHFNRDFREFAGVTPGHYRDLAPAQSHHVPVRA